MELANGKTNIFFTPQDQDRNRYYVEEFDLFSNNALKLLQQHISPDAVVLDVGCAQGNLGQVLLAFEKKCVLYGIEIDSDAAAIAKSSGNYADVFVFDISSADTNAEKERFSAKVGVFDVIVIADILEHLPLPTYTLLWLSGYVKESGHMLVSVPNIANADIGLHLLNGLFNYTHVGILDNTHLKFFTRRSFLEWQLLMSKEYPEYCFDCEYLGASYYYSDYLTDIRKNHKQLFTILEESQEFNAFQIVFKLKRLQKDTPPVLLQKQLHVPPTDVVQKLSSYIMNHKIDVVEIKSMHGSERDWYEERIEILNNSLKEISDVAFFKTQHIDALLSYVAELEELQRNNADEINQLSIKLCEQEGTIASQSERINAFENYMSDLEAANSKQYVQIASNDEQINAFREYVSRLEVSNQELFDEQDNLRTAIQLQDKRRKDLEKLLLEADNKILSMENSFFWRITKPFRKK